MRLIFGDCFAAMETIPPSSVDLIISDLPYGSTQCTWDRSLDLTKLWKAYDIIAKPNAAVLLFAQTPFDKVLGCSNLQNLKYELIWNKTRATGHLNAKKCPLKAHENILVFYRKAPTYNPQKTSGHVRKTATKKRDTTSVYGAQNAEGVAYDSTDRYPTSVLRFPSDTRKSSVHPTQKPVALLEWLIRTYSNQGDTVFDSCMGSGSTGVACVNLNRDFIGVENHRPFFDAAVERINNGRT